MLSLLSVAAAPPSDVDITIVDEQIEAIDWHTPTDLVGITCMTALAPSMLCRPPRAAQINAISALSLFFHKGRYTQRSVKDVIKEVKEIVVFYITMYNLCSVITMK